MISRLKNWFSLKFIPNLIVSRLQGKTAKRVFFLRQYEGTVKRIWGEEFVLDGMRDGREILRREYDKLVETLDAGKAALLKPDIDSVSKENTEKLVEVKSKEIEEWTKKIDDHDKVIKEMEDRISSFYDNLPKLTKRINE